MESKPVNNAVKLAGEAFLPGASLMMEGQIVPGALHLVVGTLAKMVLGPIGLGLVIANSYASATTGQGLLKSLKGAKAPEATEAAPAAAPAPVKP